MLKTFQVKNLNCTLLPEQFVDGKMEARTWLNQGICNYYLILYVWGLIQTVITFIFVEAINIEDFELFSSKY